MTETTYDAATTARLRADAELILARYPEPRSALLPLLHLVQSVDGFVSPHGIAWCAETLGLTRAEVSAVATFYSQYKRHPNGTYTVGVCTNTLCAVMGGDEIFARLAEHLGIGHDETTEDGAVTLERVECNAACDYAPVVMVNWEFFDNQTPASAIDVVERLRAGEEVAPTRGAAKVCTFKEVSRVLAGFPDGRADEGVGAGSATLEGLRLARERGWSAPPFPQPRRTPARAAPEKAAPAKAASTKAAPGAPVKPSTETSTKPPTKPSTETSTKPSTEPSTEPGAPPAGPRRSGRRPARARQPRESESGTGAVGRARSSAQRRPTTSADAEPTTPRPDAATAGEEG